MKSFTPLQLALIEQLQDGLCHSGHQLGQQFQLSRTAIWKQMNSLIAMGLPIQSLPQKGYQLHHPFFPLTEEAIRANLPPEDNQGLRLHLFTSLPSTNQYLKDYPASNYLDVCCAETQTQGRGRFGRRWHSPFGENLYCSLRFPVHVPLNQLEGLSLVVSLAILKSLQGFGISAPIELKWPNDLYYQNQKLSGCLIELQAETHGAMQLVIGIGLNINSDTMNHPLEDREWCSLYSISGQYHNRNRLLALLIQEVNHHLSTFLKSGFKAFQADWQEYDLLQGKWISVKQMNQELYGLALGVNEQGQLQLRNEDGIIQTLTSGDTSICKK